MRLADGRVFTGELAPERHRALQIGLLHARSDSLVELAAGTRRDGTLAIHTRGRADHFLPGGDTGHADWLERLLALAASHADRGEEVFLAPAVRHQPRGDKHAVTHTRALWVDVDAPGQLHHLWAFLAQRPCQLLLETAGSGGVHCYWLLDQPLPATQTLAGGGVVEPIERANARLIHRLGVGDDGTPNVADSACRDRSRLLRLAGSVNTKTGQYARILEADFRLAPYPIAALVGDLPDPPVSGTAPRSTRTVSHADPYKRISPPEYFEALAGITVPRGGLVRCPAAWHDDVHPSCSVGTDATQGWKCHGSSCGAGGAIYDLASVLLGGPWGRDLRGEQFTRARAYVADVLGDLT
ncbi:MAG: hypothetical protein ABSH51_28655 [Solirubrobacteraceae bacterium]